jgi:nitrate reductase NapE component
LLLAVVAVVVIGAAGFLVWSRSRRSGPRGPVAEASVGPAAEPPPGP